MTKTIFEIDHDKKTLKHTIVSDDGEKSESFYKIFDAECEVQIDLWHANTSNGTVKKGKSGKSSMNLSFQLDGGPKDEIPGDVFGVKNTSSSKSLNNSP